VDKVAQEQNETNNCKLEFNHARRIRKPLNMLAIVMEETMQDTGKWHGSVGATLGDYAYMTLTSDLHYSKDDFDKSVRDIAKEIDRRLENMLQNELQVAASLITASRMPSPSPNDIQSAMSTPPATPGSQHVMCAHVDDNVCEFRKDMKEFIDGFLDPRSEELAHRKRTLCELLLIAFMRDVIAPSNEVDVDDLLAWQQKCEDSSENLIVGFSEMMQLLKPSLFKQTLNFEFTEELLEEHRASVFVIDWMIQHSRWALSKVLKHDWSKKVVLPWFDPANVRSTKKFLERAECFLLKGVRDISWGVKILGNVVKTKSYVVFFRMESLAGILLREHCDIHMRLRTRTIHRLEQGEEGGQERGEGGGGGGGKCDSGVGASLLAITLLVSSANWHLSTDLAGDSYICLSVGIMYTLK